MSSAATVPASAPEAEQVPAEEAAKEVEVEISADLSAADAEVAKVSDDTLVLAKMAVAVVVIGPGRISFQATDLYSPSATHPRLTSFFYQADDAPASEEAPSSEAELAEAPEAATEAEEEESASKKRTADAADVADEEMVSKKRGRRIVGGGGRTNHIFLSGFVIGPRSNIPRSSVIHRILVFSPSAQDGSPPKKVAGDEAGLVEGEMEDPASVVASFEEKKVETAAEAAVAAAEAPAVAQQ